MIDINKIKPGDIAGVKVVDVYRATSAHAGYVRIAINFGFDSILYPSHILPVPNEPDLISDLERAVIETSMDVYYEFKRRDPTFEIYEYTPMQKIAYDARDALDKARNPPAASATDQAIAALAGVIEAYESRICCHSTGVLLRMGQWTQCPACRQKWPAADGPPEPTEPVEIAIARDSLAALRSDAKS